MAAVFMGVLAVAGCSPDLQETLAPLAELSRSGSDESDHRLASAQRLLAEELAPHPAIVALFSGSPQGDSTTLPWDRIPYVAVGAFKADGTLAGALPRASGATLDLLKRAAEGPEMSDFMIIPNTLSFTLGLRHTLPEGRTVSALLDVDRVFTDGVLKPLAHAAHGIAFLANRDRRVILSTHPSVVGQALETWQVPIPEPGADAVGKVTIGGTEYYIGASRSTSSGWIICAATPVNPSPP